MSLRKFAKEEAEKTAKVLISELFEAIRLVGAITIGAVSGLVIDLLIFAILRAGEKVTHHHAPKIIYDTNSLISYGVILSFALTGAVRHIRNNLKVAKHK